MGFYSDKCVKRLKDRDETQSSGNREIQSASLKVKILVAPSHKELEIVRGGMGWLEGFEDLDLGHSKTYSISKLALTREAKLQI